MIGLLGLIGGKKKKKKKKHHELLQKLGQYGHQSKNNNNSFLPSQMGTWQIMDKLKLPGVY